MSGSLARSFVLEEMQGCSDGQHKTVVTYRVPFIGGLQRRKPLFLRRRFGKSKVRLPGREAPVRQCASNQCYPGNVGEIKLDARDCGRVAVPFSSQLGMFDHALHLHSLGALRPRRTFFVRRSLEGLFLEVHDVNLYPVPDSVLDGSVVSNSPPPESIRTSGPLVLGQNRLLRRL